MLLKYIRNRYIKIVCFIENEFLYSLCNLITKKRFYNPEKQFYNFIPEKELMFIYSIFIYLDGRTFKLFYKDRTL